ncbi:MAG: sodium:proton antiporter [Thermoleophilia bacterium]
MNHEVIVAISGVLVGGVIAQWLGWRLRIPAIVFLLAGGVLVGPVFGILDPDETFGDVLLPMVSLAVAVILFEGSLGLGLSGVRTAGRTVWMLLTIGALTTLAGTAAAAHYILGTDWRMASLLAATVVVTGPTVVGPIVRSLGMKGRLAAILETEGTLIDSIGAILAVLVFQAAYGTADGLTSIGIGMAHTMAVGIALGIVGAALLVLAFGWYLIPDELDNATTLATVLGVFAAADTIKPEAGLVAATVMGIAMAAQRRVSVHHVLRFNETLRIIFISILFVVLAARIQPETLRTLELRNLGFLLVLILLVRPLSVALSTVFSPLNRAERIFLACTAPRGIVAAAVASVFSLRLTDVGIDNSQVLVSATFTVIAGTVLLAGLGSRPLARRLELLGKGRETTIVLGANPVAQAFAKALEQQDVPTRLIGLDRSELVSGRMRGLTIKQGSVFDGETWQEAGIEEAGRFVAMTASDELNALAARQAGMTLGRRQIYQLPPDRPEHRSWWKSPIGTFGRPLFGPEATFTTLERLMDEGWTVTATKLTEKHGMAELERSRPGAILLAIIGSKGDLQLVTTEVTQRPRVGATVLTFSRQLIDDVSDRAIKKANRVAAKTPKTDRASSAAEPAADASELAPATAPEPPSGSG